MIKRFSRNCIIVFVVIPLLASSWSRTGSMSSARYNFGATLLGNGKVLSAGGCYIIGGPSALSSAEIYNYSSGSWSSTGSMLTARSGFGIVKLFSDEVLAVGGRNVYGLPLTLAEIYNPTTETWSQVASMSTTRVGFGILVLTSGKVLVAGGETASGVITTLAEIYDPTNNSWTQTGSMHDARSGFGMVLLDNGEILVAGGSIYGMALNTAEIYDPSTGTWSRTGSMHDGVYGAGFALFTSSTSEKKVLRAGGIGSSGNILSTAEIYTPSTGTWTRTASMRDSRTGFGIVKLPNGNIFVAGGKAGLQGSVILSTTEEYIVSSGKWNKRPSMYDARCGFNLLLLNNGDILAAGGMNLYSSLSTAELYEP